ncbi:chorismate mutase [Sedimentibacter sp. zth1]|uniref:chorismate mutase n=1 Tax=Sedimentibacter sp. zth1 TaxID=2816908 RepID=UPI001A93083C|nr:chorismate mutase [Sedimentibacter sp. zth1]QSX06788.1 chorismate mutase [Sedimentibacter sp. zth1]
MRQYCIRGAITIEDNSIEQIEENTIILLKEILHINNINIDDCCSLIFTATKDITADYPAKFARKIGFINCSLMCMQEMYVENSLKFCIRVMVTINSNDDIFNPKHIYLKNAKKLRPDLIN